MTITNENIDAIQGANVLDADGDKIGSLDEIYIDDTTGQPEWAAVKTGLFGTNLSFVPLSGSTQEGDDLQVQYSKDMVKDAPRIEADGHLSEQDEAELYRYYDMDAGSTGDVAPTPTGEVTGRDTSGPTTDDAMTRSEEELNVGTRQTEGGRVRLRKYVVTENVTKTVPVSHEEVRIEREPITDENRDQALAGSDISEEEHEVTLMQEEVVTEKRVVPKERVRLDKDTVTEDQTVSQDIRKEQIEIDGDADSAQR